MLSAACTSVTEQESHSGSEYVTASIGAETRTSIGPSNDSGRKVVWSEGDRIIISAGSSSKEKAIYKAVSHGSATASFAAEDGANMLDFSTGVIAGYPVDEMYIGAPDENNELFFTIPSEQNYRKDSFDEGAMPMISDIAYEPVLNFKNAAGVLRLNLSAQESDVTISEITITTAESISGECGYIPKTRKIFFDGSMLSSNQVSLLCGSGVKVSSEVVPFYIVVPHQIYSEMTIGITTTDGLEQTFRMKSDKQITIKRSTITTIPLVLNEIEESQDPKVGINIENVTFDNIRVNIEVKNTTMYYCGLQTKQSFMRDIESNYILESLPYLTTYTSPMSYSGNISSFQTEMGDVLIEPGQSYVIWIIPYKKSGEYTVDDIVYVETMTKSFTSGGSIKVSYRDLAIDMTSISMTLSAVGSSYIYSILMTEEEYLTYVTESEKIALLLTPGGRSTVFDSYEDIFVRKFLRPGARMVLLSIAIDKSGKYGPLLTEVFQTDPVPYNNLKVNIDKDINAVKSSGTITWTVSGGTAVSYSYFLKPTSGYRWIDTFQQDVTRVEEELYLNPGLYYFGSSNTPSISTSQITESGEQILIVTAVDADGNISKADSWTFTY